MLTKILIYYGWLANFSCLHFSIIGKFRNIFPINVNYIIFIHISLSCFNKASVKVCKLILKIDFRD